MGKKSSPFDATPSALGYLHQCRCGLFYALQRDDEPNLRISIERLDDVAFERDGQAVDPVELLQFKHQATLRRQGGLGDKNPDIWKSLRIWSQAVHDKRITLDRVLLFFVTTSAATNRNAIRLLRGDPSERKPTEALKALEEAGKTSKDDEVQKAYSVLMRLSAKARRRLVEAITLLDGAGHILDIRQRLERAVRHCVAPEHKSAFVDRLEGWWFRVVVEHLMSPASDGIFVSEIHRHVHELREQFRRENLPDDFLHADVPDGALPDNDQRHFVRQLHLIELTDERLRMAQTDHYKAFTQRSRWIRDNLLNLDETDRFADRLVDEWKHRFEIMREGIAATTDDRELTRSGRNLYNWTQTDAPGHAALLIRPEFRSQYMTRGSYHMLADLLRVGWHPEFEKRLRSNGCPVKEKGDESVA